MTRPLLFTLAALLCALLLAATAAFAAYQLQTAWGGQGSAAGQFNGPGYVATSPDGTTVYVVDSGNNRVEFFTSDGGFLDQFGAAGSGQGQFNAPTGVAVGPDGTVYVTDTGNNRVERFSADGKTFLTQWGTAGSLDGQFSGPTGIAVGPDGSVYVADSGNARVERFLADGTHVANVGVGGLSTSLRGVAVGPDGSVYVVDGGNSRVAAFDASNNPVTSWGTSGTGDGQFQSPIGIAATSQGVYVVDQATNRVEKFTTTGAFIDSFDSGLDSALNLPIGVAVSSAGQIFTSQSNGRVARYGETGGGGGGSLPPPQTGETANAVPVDGTVKVRRPGSNSFELLKQGDQIPIGSIVDVRDGTVALTTTASANTTQTANFFEGVFQLLQDKGKSPVTEVRLYGANFKKACKRGGKSTASAAASKKSVRHLWGKGAGKFRTKGRYASAVIRGTQWLTDDRCDGTNVRVKQGSVTVRDLVKRKNVVVKAPKSYLAKPKGLRK